MGKVSNEPINSKSKEPAISKTSIQKDQAKAKEAKPNDHELKIDTYMKSFHDPTYKFQKFNPKKKCSRCEQLNAFSCEVSAGFFGQKHLASSFSTRVFYCL
jgi:hypothetical protein